MTADVQRPCKCGGRFGVVGTGCATWCPGPTDPAPVTADVQRELAEALGGLPVSRIERGAALGRLLPVIERAEKRAAAAAYEQGQEDLRHTLDLLHARAAALDPAGAASGETT